MHVYSLSDGMLVRNLQNPFNDSPFSSPFKICFSGHGNLLVCNTEANQVVEMELSGQLVRAVSVNKPVCVDSIGGLVAIGVNGGAEHAIELFKHGIDSLVDVIGTIGTAPGCIRKCCASLRFTHDGHHLIVADHSTSLSVFAVSGEFVRSFHCAGLSRAWKDIALTADGGFAIADSHKRRLCVYEASKKDDLKPVVVVVGTLGDGVFHCPTATCVARNRLYVLDADSALSRVHIFV